MSLGSAKEASAFVDLFLEECPRLLIKLKRAISASDSSEVAEVAHELKGVVVHMDAARAAEILRRIEAGACEDDARTLELWLAGLEEELAGSLRRPGCCCSRRRHLACYLRFIGYFS